MRHATIAKRASGLVGGTSALARILGRSSSEVSQWISGNRPIPITYAAAIERATNGLVTRRDLRPQDWHLIWPELAHAAKEPADFLPSSPSYSANAEVAA